MFVMMFGILLPKMGPVPHGYTTLMLPGVLALSLTLSAIQSVALPMVAYQGDRGPAARAGADRAGAIEKMVAGLLQGIVAALFVLPIARLIMGPIHGLSFANPGLLFLATVMGGAAFSAIGLWLGTAIAPQQIGLMFSVILAPMIMFGCTYYPWVGLGRIRWMKWAVLVNALVYASEAMRAALTPGVPHMPAAAIFAALVVVTAIFLFLGLRAFDKRAMG
jgi:ABC-2 type transport system permease protein